MYGAQLITKFEGGWVVLEVFIGRRGGWVFSWRLSGVGPSVGGFLWGLNGVGAFAKGVGVPFMG